MIKNYINRNSIINLTLLFISLMLGIFIHPLYFLIWPAVLFGDDILFYTTGKSIFDPEIRIQMGYQFAHVYLDQPSSDCRDLGFNLYDHNMKKDKAKAQVDKWDYMLQQLNLKHGDSLIDIGCGYGDWLNYAKSKGINVVGVNITPEQAEFARQQFGIEIICSNWKDIPKDPQLRQKLFGKFDAVTFMDTIEHYVSIRDRYDLKEQGRIYGGMFELAHQLLKKEAQPKRIFISCLHRTKPDMNLKDRIGIYLLDKYHSGFYPLGDDGLTRWCHEYFSEISRADHTEDYRLTSVLDSKHFGAPKITWNLQRLKLLPLLFLLDPHHLHKWIDIYTDTWMWWHFGSDAYNPSYDNDYQKNKRNVTLWWLILEQKRFLDV